ncbi:MAG: hypothetical protein IPH06_12355 [Alphaproteobacteria bacterium]|nr:hypothetical protein [Alphaproteobacteria bacterium]QQS56260.1 MAG: hypothetical protein IPN28_08110 [Alphaproteobacteria bacterium]
MSVVIELTKDEALVLLAWLSNNDKSFLEGTAEQRALWNLECLLEKQLAEPFLDNYGQLVNDAKKRLKDT